MGLLGGVLLLGGLGMILLGLFGVVVCIWEWNFAGFLGSIGFIVGGLACGTIAATILE